MAYQSEYNSISIVILEQDILSVNSLLDQIKQLNEMSFPDIWVEGEVSSVSSPASGHIYFSLKDSQAVLRCVLFKNKRFQVASLPETGNRLLIRGRISVYTARSDLQLIASYMEPAGDGQFRREFEQLKTQLHDEGLFDDKHKRPIPAFPQTIGIISSAQSAAFHDILKTIRHRFPVAQIKLFPVSVQGKRTADEIIEAITIAQSLKPDCLLLARGGGSQEDLHAFNEEKLARSIHSSAIPIITGIGHQTDFTIADFVADLRAPTPTGAATLSVPDTVELNQTVVRLGKRLSRNMAQQLETRQLTLDYIRRQIKSPQEEVAQQRLQLRQATRQISQASVDLRRLKQNQLKTLISHLQLNKPSHKIALQKARNLSAQPQLNRLLANRIAQKAHRLGQLKDRLRLLNPQATLNRGYAIVYDEQGAIISASNDVQSDQVITTQLANGKITSVVK